MPNNAFPYPGNKARHAEWILQHIPEHECYVEPFGGAAGVLFNKPRSKVEVYNDIDGDIVHFFEVLRDRPEELQAWLERVPHARELHKEWATDFYEGHRPDDDIERAGRWFFLRYSQFAGKVYGISGFLTSHHRSFAGQFSDKTQKLTTFAKRLKNVTIESSDYANLISTYDAHHTVFYCDPPYNGSEYQYGGGAFDHHALHDALSECEAKVLVSYDDVPPFYGDGWQVATKSSHYAMDNSARSGGAKDATEVLLMNFDADGQPLMSDVGQQTIESF